ncbi:MULTISPECIES: hypothetical protein [unclassified Ruegeria]|uniref:hypothetical protein n=1 Tax=unclassified Ruegeria TaxID=2625375 RepID=UPI0014877BE3|nr:MULTISPECIES: hypothetical protein [unclassified Ruegeria]NOE33484.1 hypothetical protein [Ruegeria sp. HKCCD7318]
MVEESDPANQKPSAVSPDSAEANKTTNQQSEWVAEAKKTTISFLSKLLVPLAIAALALLFLNQIKAALGITAIERYLVELQKSVAHSEDTVFYHQFEFQIPSLKDEENMLAFYGISEPVINLLDRNKIDGLEGTLKEFWRNALNEERAKSQTDEFVPIAEGGNLPNELILRVRNDINTLRKANIEIDQTVFKNFPFSAAIDALVTIWHNVNCHNVSNFPTKEVVAYSMKVDQVQLSRSGIGEHYQDLDLDGISVSNLVPTETGSDLRQLSLVLEIFPERGAAEGITAREALERRAVGATALSSCSFEIMIYVRDNPREFQPGGLGRTIQSFMKKNLGG